MHLVAPVQLGCPPLLSGDVEHVVATDEGVAVLVLELTVQVLLTLLKTYVHVAVQTCQHTSVINTGVEFDDNGPADDQLQELIGALFATRHLSVSGVYNIYYELTLTIRKNFNFI